LFGDGVTLAVCSTAAMPPIAACQGRPHREPLFGDGVGIAVKKEQFYLRRALDYALQRLSSAASTRIYLKYFRLVL